MRAKYIEVLGPFSGLCDHDRLVTAASAECAECDAKLAADETLMSGETYLPEKTLSADSAATSICPRWDCRDPFCRRVHMQECQRCGALVESLNEVDEIDVTVGYSATMSVCDSCLIKRAQQ